MVDFENLNLSYDAQSCCAMKTNFAESSLFFQQNKLYEISNLMPSIKGYDNVWLVFGISSQKLILTRKSSSLIFSEPSCSISKLPEPVTKLFSHPIPNPVSNARLKMCLLHTIIMQILFSLLCSVELKIFSFAPSP